MTRLRSTRRKYYDQFAPFYDSFVRLHASKERNATRASLVGAARLEGKRRPRVLDICCGTGDVILAFAKRQPEGLLIGYDFSRRMLLKAVEKDARRHIFFIEGDAVELPFKEDSFDAVSCSHALYELKRDARQMALREMRRVVNPGGVVLLMEHEMPSRPLVRWMFYLRILSMGSEDAWEFIRGGTELVNNIFSEVVLTHSPSGKSKLLICKK